MPMDAEVRGNVLVGVGRSRRGGAYRHTCTAATYERVAGWIDDLAGAGFTLQGRARQHPDPPLSQTRAALAYLARYGLVTRSGRYTRSAVPYVYEEAMEHYEHDKEIR